MIRVVIADDQHMVRGALTALLSIQPDLEVVAEASDGAAAVDAVVATDADIALLDIEMPGMDGVAAAVEIRARAPRSRILILTTFGRPGYLRRCMDAGAHGFVVKDAPAGQLAESVRRVHAGEAVVDPALAVASLHQGPNPLSEREQDVLRLSGSGATTTEIATQLNLSKGTVRNYLSAAITKCGSDTRTAAARAARDNGWL